MVKRNLGLTRSEVRQSRTALISAIVIVISVTLALSIEYMIEDNLRGMGLFIQLAIAGFMFLVIVCIIVAGSKGTDKK